MVFFSKYLSNTSSIFNKILAIPKLIIDTLKNVFKFFKTSQVFGGEGLKIGVNWRKKLIHIFTFLALISYNAAEL